MKHIILILLSSIIAFSASAQTELRRDGINYSLHRSSPRQVELSDLPANPVPASEVEGNYTFYIGDHLFEGSVGNKAYDGSISIDGRFAQLDFWGLPVYAEYDEESGALIFTQQYYGYYEEENTYFVRFEPFVFDDDGNIVPTDLYVSYDQQRGAFVFPGYCGFSWVSYADEECTQFSGYYYGLAYFVPCLIKKEEEGKWVDYDSATFVDGWILPKDSLNPTDYPWKVTVQQNIDNPNLFRIYNPYVSEGCPVKDQAVGEGHIVFDLSDPENVLVQVGHYCGVMYEPRMIETTNPLGFHWNFDSENYNSYAELQTALSTKASYYDTNTGTVRFNDCCFMLPNRDVVEEGFSLYYWIDQKSMMNGWLRFDNKSPVAVKVESISLLPKSKELTVSESFTLTVSVSPSNATDKRLGFESSNTSVATVDAYGKVTAKARGTAVITCTANDGSEVSATCNVTVTSNTVYVKSINLLPTSIVLMEDDTYAISATVSPAEATDKSVSWKSSDTSVATVDSNGKVTAKAAGTAVITCTANDGSGVSATCDVTVYPTTILAIHITLTPTSKEVTEGDTFIISASVEPSEATNKSVSWKSDDTSVATVDSNGKVTAKAPGTTTIICTANDLSGTSATCNVTVTAKIGNMEPVTFEYDGRNVTINCADDKAEIYYVLEGDGKEIKYEGPFDLNGLHEATATARRTGYTESVNSLSPNVYANETYAATKEEGLLSSAFRWADESLGLSIETYSISGKLNANDYSFLRIMKGLRHLDLAEVTSSAIPDKAFAQTGLVSVNLPKGTTSYGKELFSGNTSLCAITLNGTAKPSTATFSGFNNPNLLCYLSKTYQETNGSVVADVDWLTNIVTSSDIVTNLSLTDGYPFNAPKAFTANTAQYVKNFSKETAIGGSQGWETISLPFDVQAISQGTCVLKPFASYSSQEGTKPFWLYAADGTAWAKTDKIEAYKPYIISMPNNPKYSDKYNTSGDVTFSAKSVKVGATPEATGHMFYSDCTLWPNFSTVSKGLGLYVINIGWYESDAPGSLFVAGDHNVMPFECYATSGTARKALPIFGSSGVEGIEDLGEEMDIWSERGDILIDSPYDATLPIYDLTGQRVRVLNVHGSILHRESGLTPGVYLVKDRKVVVR